MAAINSGDLASFDVGHFDADHFFRKPGGGEYLTSAFRRFPGCPPFVGALGYRVAPLFKVRNRLPSVGGGGFAIPAPGGACGFGAGAASYQ